MPSASAAQPPARASRRDRRKTFIMFPFDSPGRTGPPRARTEPRPPRLIHRGVQHYHCTGAPEQRWRLVLVNRLADLLVASLGGHHDPAGLAPVLGLVPVAPGQAEAHPLGD